MTLREKIEAGFAMATLRFNKGKKVFKKPLGSERKYYEYGVTDGIKIGKGENNL